MVSKCLEIDSLLLNDHSVLKKVLLPEANLTNAQQL